MVLQIIGYNPVNNSFFVNFDGEIEEWCSEDWRLADSLELIENHREDYLGRCNSRRFNDNHDPEEIKKRLEDFVKFGDAIENLSARKICEKVTKWVLQIK